MEDDDGSAPAKGYSYVTFVCHKPLNVVSSTVDNAPAGVRRGAAKQKKERKAQRRQQQEQQLQHDGDDSDGDNSDTDNNNNHNSPTYRRTVWDVAQDSGFPTNVGLVGRLDCATSGIVLFSNDARLADAVRNPPPEGSALWHSVYKTKEYELTLLSSQPWDDPDGRDFDVPQFEHDFAQPLTFSKEHVVYRCNAADVTVERRYRDEARSRGRPNLGWTLVLRVVLREGKHHQIRRLAHRAGYHIVSLHRRAIATVLHVDTVPAPGQCRWVTRQELDALYMGLGLGEVL